MGTPRSLIAPQIMERDLSGSPCRLIFAIKLFLSSKPVPSIGFCVRQTESLWLRSTQAFACFCSMLNNVPLYVDIGLFVVFACDE